MNYRKIAMALAMSALFNLATVANAQKDARSLVTSKPGFSPDLSKQIGNGLSKVILRGASGLTDGEEPGDLNVVFRLFEGASLVVVGTGTANVGLLDGQAGTTFVGTTFSNYYQLPATTASGSRVLLDNFGYDGQIGASRSIFSPTSNETSSVSGYPSLTFVQVAGPGVETSNSDWDGSSGWPLPQLWDDTGYDISNAFAAGDTFVLVNYTSGNDCIGTVGAVISVQ